MKEPNQSNMAHLAQARDLRVKQRSALKAKINNLLSYSPFLEQFYQCIQRAAAAEAKPTSHWRASSWESSITP